MKTINTLVMVVLTVVAAVIWGPQVAAWTHSPPNLTRYPLGPRFYCENCGWHFDASPRRMAPLKCPKCGKPTAMKTLFSASAGAPEFIRCRKCQAYTPYQLFKWPPEEKRRWDKRLGELEEGQFLAPEEMEQLQQTKLVKTSTQDWMKWVDFVQLPSAQMSAVRCSKCGNTDPAQFDYSPPPPGAATGH